MKADLVIKNGSIVTPEATLQGGVAIADGKIVAIGASDTLPDGKRIIDASGLHILPGLIDAHVHFRDPGVTHKEDFSTGLSGYDLVLDSLGGKNLEKSLTVLRPGGLAIGVDLSGYDPFGPQLQWSPGIVITALLAAYVLNRSRSER